MTLKRCNVQTLINHVLCFQLVEKNSRRGHFHEVSDIRVSLNDITISMPKIHDLTE